MYVSFMINGRKPKGKTKFDGLSYYLVHVSKTVQTKSKDYKDNSRNHPESQGSN